MSKVISFVQLVEQYPCLYNHSLPEYSRKDITDQAWTKVGREMKWSITYSKEKWKNIRNGFVRSLKPVANGSSAKHKKPYYLYDIMQFVLPFVKPVISASVPPPPDIETIVKIQDAQRRDETETEEDLAEAFSTIAKNDQEASRESLKRRKLCANEVDKSYIDYLNKKPKDLVTDDHRQMFLLSLLPDVNKLSDTEMREFKMKTLIFLDEILTRPRYEQTTQEPNPPENVHNSSAASSIIPSVTHSILSTSLIPNSIHYETFAQENTHCTK